VVVDDTSALCVSDHRFGSWLLEWGYLGLGNRIMRRNELRGMTGGDVSHSSGRSFGYLYERHRPGFVFSLIYFFFFFLSYVHLLCVCFYLDVYLLIGGASSPEWVKPTAEGGGIGFLFICFCFVICSFVICLFLFLFLST
jgi:hypothetical protein